MKLFSYRKVGRGERGREGKRKGKKEGRREGGNVSSKAFEESVCGSRGRLVRILYDK